MSKPNAAAIRAAKPLSMLLTFEGYRLQVCNICGKPSKSLSAWIEGDERDKHTELSPIVFIASDHADCMKLMEKHPRLYTETRGEPGWFPKLCGECGFRRAAPLDRTCSHPKLKANGGAGLRVDLSGGFPGLVCIKTSKGSVRPLRHATSCEGHAEWALAQGAQQKPENEHG